MSKKKVMPRSTMTLKDFHGGSIPSDLQLPSAPGMTVDRSAYERQGPNAWTNNSLNRGYGGDRGGYHRQGPMNGIRTFEDKASYFPNPANIGRNYDEDERRPVDSRPGIDRYEDYGRGGSSYDTGGGLDKIGYSGALSYADPRGAALSDRHPSQTREYDNGASYKGQLSRSPERLQYSSYQSVGRFASQSASSPRTMSEPPQNVWTARREGEQGRGRSGEADAAVVSPWRVRNNIARIAEASAIDKVSSGRWQPDHNRSVVTNLDRKSADSPYPADVFDARKEIFEAPHSSDSRKIESFQTSHGPEAFDSWKAENHHTFDNRKLENFHSSQQGFENRVSLGPDTWQSPNLHPSSERGFGSSDRHTEAENSEVLHEDRRFTSSDRDRPSNVRAGYNDGVRSSYIDTGKAAYIRPYTDSGSRVGASDVQGGGGVSDSGRSGYTAYNDHRTGRSDSFRGGYSEPSDQRYAETPVDYSEARLSNAPRSMNREDFHGSGHGGYDRLEAHSEVGHADDRNGPFSYSMDAQDSHRHYVAQSDYINVAGNRQGHYLAGNDGATKMLPNRESVGSGPKSMPSDDGLRVPYTSEGLQRQYSSEWERNRSPPKQEFNYQSSSHASTMVGSTYSDSGKSGAALLRSDSGERPKLKLLPRSKPVDNSSEQNSKEAFRPEVEIWTEDLEALDKRGIAYESNVLEQAEAEQDMHRHSERPKLNLKPRTQLVEGVATTEKERKNLFGGARPRELVLKERGADDAVIVGVEAVSTPVASDANRLNSRDLDGVRTERKDRWSDVKQEGRQFERHDNRSFERQASSGRSNLERQDSGKGFSRREQDIIRNDQDRYDNRRDFGRQDRRDHEKQDVAKRDIDKQESWRRPVDPPPQSPSPVVSALAELPSRSTPGKYGVGASALELAQAFSRSTSLSRTSQSRSPGRRLYGAKEASDLPGTFSRLTDVQSPGYGGRNNGKLASYEQRDSGFSGSNDFLGRRGLPVRSREGY